MVCSLAEGSKNRELESGGGREPQLRLGSPPSTNSSPAEALEEANHDRRLVMALMGLICNLGPCGYFRA